MREAPGRLGLKKFGPGNWESWGKAEKFEEKLRKLRKNWKSWGKTATVEEKLRESRKNWERFRSKKFGPKICLSIFSLNWIILRKDIFCLEIFFNCPSPPRPISGNLTQIQNWRKIGVCFLQPEQPEALKEWKFESMTDGPTDLRTDWHG